MVFSMLRFFSAVIVLSAIAAPAFAEQTTVTEQKSVIVAQNKAQPAVQPAQAKKPEAKPAENKEQAAQPDSQKAAEKPATDAKEPQEAASYDQDSANAPERKAECLWTGQRIVTLLLRDDINTAREHLNFYDRFGCPKESITAAFRCSILQGERQPQQTDIAARVYGCWMSPEVADRQ